MGFLLAILLTPGILALAVLLVRYANWMRAHRDFRYMEDLRDRLAHKERDMDLYSTYRKARFDWAYNRCRRKQNRKPRY